MQLVSSPLSPFVRKVRALLHETGLADRVSEIPVTTSPLDTAPEVISANPLGRIPVLLRDDGAALYDSRVICRYLDAQAGAGLYPEARLWDVLTLEATADGIMDSCVLMIYETRLRAEGARSEPWFEAQWAKIARALDALEARWISHLAGPLDMGQIALACALGYIDFRFDARGWRTGHPALAAWHEGIAARDSMARTAPVG
jgi:glutathione S-transferase